jgi:hypothetical protein
VVLENDEEVSGLKCIRNEDILDRVNGERNIIHTIK